MKWSRSLKGKVKFNESLSRHTSFKIGGICRVWFEPNGVDDLIACLRFSKKEKLPHFIIGDGTNILIRNGGFHGIVIKLNTPSFKGIDLKNKTMIVGAGARISTIINFLADKNVRGYEFLAGVPGTVGGALIMNAGTTFNGRRCAMGDIVRTIRVLDRRGCMRNLTRKSMRFGYRDSNLGHYVLLEAHLQLKRGNKTLIKNRIKNFMVSRTEKQDYSRPSAGCIFKNYSTKLSAASLIERSGCKGMRCGGAMVSKKHANFILNFNSATANDVIKLIGIIKERVGKTFGIQLNEEIKIV